MGACSSGLLSPLSGDRPRCHRAGTSGLCLLFQSSWTLGTPVLCGAILVSTHSTPGAPWSSQAHAEAKCCVFLSDFCTLPVDSRGPCSHPSPALQCVTMLSFSHGRWGFELGSSFLRSSKQCPTVPSPSCSLQFWARAGAVASGQRFTHGDWRRQPRSQASLSSTWAQRWNLVYQLGDKLRY